VIVESSVINYLHQSYIFFITFPVDRGESKSSVGRGLYHERAGGVNLFLFRIYNIDFWQYGWLYPVVPLRQFKSRSLSTEANLFFSC